MNAVVYIDQEKHDVLSANLYELTAKLSRARSQKVIDEIQHEIVQTKVAISVMPKQINPKFVEKLLEEIDIFLQRFNNKLDGFKEKFNHDPIAFLEWNQTDFVRYYEQQSIFSFLYANIVEIQKLEPDLHILKILKLFEQFNAEMTERVMMWAENPYNSSSQQANLVESVKMTARSVLIRDMGEFKNLFHNVKEAYEFSKITYRTGFSPSTECAPAQA